MLRTCPARRVGGAVLLVVLCSVPTVSAQPCNDDLIVPGAPIAGANFGRSVALEGETLVVGAAGRATGESDLPGEAFVFTKQGRNWNQVATLSCSGSMNGDAFGYSVAIRGDVIAVGAPYVRNSNDEPVGAVYLFQKPEAGWQSTEVPDDILLAATSAGGDQFGASIGIGDQWMIVGSPFSDRTGVDNAGAVTTFSLEGGAWIERATLTSPEPLRDEHFGLRLILEDDMLIVSAPNLMTHTLPGSVHIFMSRGPATAPWVRVQKLSGGPDQRAGDHFGRSLALSLDETSNGGCLLIGSTGDDPHGEHSGTAHLFSYQEVSPGEYEWVRTLVLAPQDGSIGDHFGFSVAICGKYLLVSASFANQFPLWNVGRAYLYQYDPVTATATTLDTIQSECPTAWANLGSTTSFFVDARGNPQQMLLGVPGAVVDGAVSAGAILVKEFN